MCALVPGRSVVWLARLLWEQEAVSSNLTVPTILPHKLADTHHLYLTNGIRGYRD